MKAGWELKTLGDVASITNGGTPKSEVKHYWGGDVAWLTPKDMGKLTSNLVSNTSRSITAEGLSKCSAKLVPENSVILSTRAPIGHLAINTVPMAFNQGCRGLVPNGSLNLKYLFHYLSANVDVMNELGTGTTFKELSAGALKNLPIPLPPLEEQKRIVSILDEAFEGLDRARENAEANLKSARELFDAFLVSVEEDKSPLGKFVKIRTGKLNANAAVEGGEYPFFTCSRGAFQIDHFAFDCEAILLAGNNASGDFNVKHYRGKFNAYQRTYVIEVIDTNSLDYRFLYFQMIRSLKELKESSKGTNTKFLKLGMIQDLEISVPAFERQLKLVKRLDALNITSEDLMDSYRTKLQDISDLRQSLLQKAFAGELT